MGRFPLQNVLQFLCAILFTCTTPIVLGDDTRLSAYEVLGKYGFPIGLLPEGVTGYELNPGTGEFVAHLSGTCRFSIQSYELEYESRITGIITKDRLKNLKGVKVHFLFLWINIVEVIRDGNELRFSVGIISTEFPIENFFECPRCGCGLDCVNLKENIESVSFERLL